MLLGSTTVHIVEWTPGDDCHQCLMSPGGLQLSPVSLGGSPRSTGGFDPGCFQITASALGSECVRFLYVLFKSRVPVSHCCLGLRKVSLADIQSQTFWRLVFPVRDPWGWGACCGSSDVASCGELCNWNYPPACGLPTQGSGFWLYGFWLYCNSAPPSYLYCQL